MTKRNEPIERRPVADQIDAYLERINGMLDLQYKPRSPYDVEGISVEGKTKLCWNKGKGSAIKSDSSTPRELLQFLKGFDEALHFLTKHPTMLSAITRKSYKYGSNYCIENSKTFEQYKNGHMMFSEMDQAIHKLALFYIYFEDKYPLITGYSEHKKVDKFKNYVRTTFAQKCSEICSDLSYLNTEILRLKEQKEPLLELEGFIKVHRGEFDELTKSLHDKFNEIFNEKGTIKIE
jgi:hypothetical protein